MCACRLNPVQGICVLFVALIPSVLRSEPSPPNVSSPPGRTEGPSDPAAAEDDAGTAPGALSAEEASGRFQQLLERRPLHTQAFAGLVKHYAEQGKLADLVQEYENKVASLPDDPALKIVLARLYLRAGQPERAAALLDEIGAAVGTLGRDESKWLVFKAEVYQKTNRREAAEAVLHEAVAKAKTVSERLRLAEATADLHLAAGDRDRAAAALTALAGELGEHYLHRKRICDALAQRDLHEAAVAQLRELLPLTEGQPDQRCETLRQLGRSLERLDRKQEAIDAYSEAVNLLAGGHWLQQELHERIVALYRATGRLDDLVSYCRRQIERAPEQTGMRVLLADVLAASGATDAAKGTLEEAVQLFPKERLLSERRVQLLERLDDAAGAAAEYERIITQQPDDVELYIAYGQFLANHRRLDAARNQWKHVLHSELTDAALAHRLGTLFEPYELLDDAVECYERAIQLSPERGESYAALARLWFVRGEKEKARATLERMGAAAPDDASHQAAIAQAATALGLTDEALAAITRACALAPEHAEYQTIRSDLLVQAGRLDDALRVRRAALALLTQPGQLAQAVNILISMHASAQKLEALKTAERDRLKESPQDLTALLLLARTADFERDFVGARQWLDQLLETDPAHEEARHQLARLLEASGDVDGAVEAYRKLIDLHPARARQWYQAIADLKLRYGDKAGAVETFQQIVQTAPGNATVLKDVAEQLAKMGEWERSIEHYERSLRLQADRPDIRLQYANTLNDAGRLEEALAAYRAVALQKTDRDSAMEAMSKLHEVAARIGALDDLLDQLQAQVEANPEDTLVAHALADLLIREYEYTRAMEMIDLVLRHQPRDAELHLARAELLRRLAKFDDALETYRRVLRFPDIDRDYVLGEMGKACFEAGRIDAARSHWRQIGHKLYAGSLLRNNGLLLDAIDVLQEGIRLKPDDYGLHRNLVRTLAAAGKTDEALEAARRLLDLEPDNVVNIRELAKAYLERGNRAAATEVAARLFSAAVQEKQLGAGGGMASAPGASLFALSMQSAWSSIYGWGGSGQSPRNNLDAAVQFFTESGLRGELQDILIRQLEMQPDNALLKLTSAELFAQVGEPQRSLQLLKELETATFPLERQDWLGQCSQLDYFRLRQYQLIAAKPALRDARLAELEPRAEAELTRDERIELAVVRQAQGLNDKAVELLRGAVEANDQDPVALGALINLLMSAERYRDAEPYVRRLIARVAQERARLADELVERVRRDFVRALPLQLQLRVTDDLLRDIAHKWTLGQTFAGQYVGLAQTIGYFRARLILATILAKTDRLGEAREIWQELAPTHPADVDGWTMLAGVAQLHDQQDLALAFYEKAMQAARVLAADPLYQRIFGGSLSQAWFGEEGGIDTAFNKIVGTFAAAGKLVELYDFLRDTDQEVKARRVAQQYELFEALKTLYQLRFEEARAAFRASNDDPLQRSVPYLMAACKLAELHDATGAWSQAEAVYRQYLDDFPDELALLLTLSEVAEKQGDYAQAVDWARKVVACQERLSRRARDWSLRELPMLPAVPQVLGDAHRDRWEWQARWGRNSWWGGPGGQRPLEVWPSWIRVGELYLAVDNVIAAGNAMERAISAAGSDRDTVAHQVLALIKQRQLGAKLLSVVRAMAVQLPTDEAAQGAFADALEANGRQAAAAEVYRRMIRRGMSDIGTLTQVKQRLAALEGAPADAEGPTLAGLEAEVAAEPGDATNRLRLAKAYYYSLQIDKALETAKAVLEIAPHLEGLHDLLIEIYTVQGDRAQIMAALRTKILRTNDADEKNAARQRLANELLAGGETEQALDVLKELADPRNPNTYETLGLLLHYFGRHDEAIAQFEQASRSQQASMWSGDRGGMMQVRARVIKGDVPAAADKLLDAVDAQARQAVQYGGLAGMWSYGDMESRYFQPFVPVLILEPKLGDAVAERLEARHREKPDDPQVTKLLYQFYGVVGRRAQADRLLEEMAGREIAEQTLVTRLVDHAIRRREYEKAIRLAEKFIAEQPKPTVPPGIPPQLAGMLSVMTPRNAMLCKLGDVYWKMGQGEKAFEYYRQILDEKVDESRVSYAAICLMRDRLDDARQLVETALTGQEVKSPGLLQFRAVLAALADRADAMFQDLARAVEISDGAAASPFSYGESNDGAAQLAQAAQRTNQIDAYVEFMNKRIQKNPNRWPDYAALAGALRNAGRAQEALEVLERALKVNTVRREALELKIRWLEGFASAEELIGLYQELLDLSEKQTKSGGAGSVLSRIFGGGSSTPTEQVDTQPLRDRLADLLWQTGQKDQAGTVWAARMDPKAASTHIALGRRYLEKRDEDRAAAHYRTALELEPNNAEAHRALAELTFHSGDWEATLGHLREVFLVQYGFWGQSGRQRPADYGYDVSGQDATPWWSGGEECLWAADLARAPRITERLRQATSPEDLDASLMLAVLTGDWTTAETHLERRLQAQPYDPMSWTLWANVKERRGQWPEAIQAWETVRRLKQTTIAEHRDQLKLVLAGKQVKEASAGEKEAKDPASAGSSGSSRGYYPAYYDSDYSSTDADAARLAALYVKTGRFQEAERLLLIGERGGVRAVLPHLAALMWKQGMRDRALELLRLALTVTDEARSLPQYASMLAEAGEIDAATDLLVRAYCCGDDEDMYGGRGAMFYGGGRAALAELETYSEQQYAEALHQILKKTGTFDAALRRLQERSAATADDARLAKLVLSLLSRDRRWSEARVALERVRQAQPDDPALLRQELQIQIQLQEWDAGLATLEALRRAVPENAQRWRMHEAFLRLMKQDRAGARAAIASDLGPAPADDLGRDARQMSAVLCAARDADGLIAYLEAEAQRGPLDDDTRVLLIELYKQAGRWEEAVRAALRQLWEEPEPFTVETPPFGALVSAVRGAETAGQVPPGDPSHPEDGAMIALAGQDAAAGKAALERLVTEQPDNLNARRGLVFAAEVCGDAALAARAGEQLLTWLEPRRQEPWRAPLRRSLQDTASALVRQMKAGGLNTEAILQVSMSFPSIIQQFLGEDERNDSAAGATCYELWQAYAQRQPELLLAAGGGERLPALLQAQADHQRARTRAEGSSRDASGSYYVSRYGYSTRQTRWRRSPNRPEGFNPDADQAARVVLERHGLFVPLVEAFDRLDARVPAAEWCTRSDALAAVGRVDEARQWRHRAADGALIGLLATDAPRIEMGSGYGWWWYGSTDRQDSTRLRQALEFAFDPPEDDEAWSSRLAQRPGAPSDFARSDDEVRARLLALAAALGPGWDETRTFGELVAYYRMAREPARIIELCERVLDFEALLRSPQLDVYLWACYAARDYDRAKKVLDAVLTMDSGVADAVQLARLLLFRLRGNPDEADALEHDLLARCRREPRNPAAVDELLAAPLGEAGNRPTRSSGIGSSAAGAHGTARRSALAGSEHLTTISDLAQALGLSYVPEVDSEDLTVQRLAEAYASVRLFDDAVRLLDVRRAEEGDTSAPRARTADLLQRAEWLEAAGQQEAARKTADELETLWKDEARSQPSDPVPPTALVRLYVSKAYGCDYTKALEVLTDARKLNPALDPYALQEARCFFELGRYNEAWPRYEAALRRGAELSVDQWYRAGLSAQHAGEGARGLEVLRLALWRAPEHVLASRAREFVHD
jgi:tetratricopeptide (TPR) repeat protein